MACTCKVKGKEKLHFLQHKCEPLVQSLFWFSDSSGSVFACCFSQKAGAGSFCFLDGGEPETGCCAVAERHSLCRSKYAGIPVASTSLFTGVFLWF